MGLGNLSPSGQQGSDEMRAKMQEALGLLNQLQSKATKALGTYNAQLAAIQAVGIQQATSDAQAAGQAIGDALSFANKQSAAIKSLTIPPAQPSSYPISDAAWHNINDVVEPQISDASSAIDAALASLPGILSGAQNAVRASAAAQQNAQLQQQQKDQRAVQQARTASLGLMNQGNFDGAAAALQAQDVQDAAGRIGYDLSPDLAAISAAKSGAASQKSNASDAAIVQRARSQAVGLMNLGNFTGALAAIQSQNVTDAASRIGYDLSPDVAAVSGAQANAQKLSDAQSAAQTAQSNCESQGGTWTGNRCDMSAVAATKAQSDASAKVDAALSQATALDAAGSYRAALMVLSGVARDAQVAGRGSDVAVLVAQVQGDQQGAACAARGGTWDGNACSMPSQAPPAPPPPPMPQAPSGPDAQTACIQAGGQWDGANCAMPPPSWITSLLSSILAPAPAPQGAPPSYAPVSQGPSQRQLEAMAILSAYGGAQGQSLANALAPAMAPQGPISAGGAGTPDGTPCVTADGSPAVYQGGRCRSVPPPSGVLYGAPQVESF